MTVPGFLSDRYQLGEILGFGGMSEVYLARDLRLDRDVAIKVLRADLARNPSFYLRFRLEAQHAASLNHIAIVAVFDTGEVRTPAGRLPYIVMEYVDGLTLRNIVDTRGPMPAATALEVTADVCQALSFSHQHGIIHRDVKPANIMISTTGAVKVMDFGIARGIGDPGSITQTAAVVGTAQYLSPEQACAKPVDARSDVYSLGCVLFELLTGEPPFAGDTPVAVAYQHVREDPVPPSRRNSALSPDVDAVVLTALAKNPDNRYQNANEMRADLVRILSGEPPKAPKVLTETERISLLAQAPPEEVAEDPDRQKLHVVAEPRESGARGSALRWLAAVAALAALTVGVTIAVNVHGANTRDIAVPDMTGKSSAEAIADLQNHGFEVRPHQQRDNVVPMDHVISTDPAANASVRAGEVIDIHVSLGPEQRQVPDVGNQRYPAAVSTLNAAGFKRTRMELNESSPEAKDTVLRTDPPAHQTSSVISEITLVVGAGPRIRTIPDVSGQTLAMATRNLNVVGFTEILEAPVDNTAPAGVVLTTTPPAGTDFAVDTAITLKVSRGNQFLMPDLTGMFYLDLLPQLQQIYGFTGRLFKGADVPVPDPAARNRVVTQDPAPGTAVSSDGTITLNYGA
jgi:eukaryotic-like serine/threonine-protein kinase